jgi:hypothetical protein
MVTRQRVRMGFVSLAAGAGVLVASSAQSGTHAGTAAFEVTAGGESCINRNAIQIGLSQSCSHTVDVVYDVPNSCGTAYWATVHMWGLGPGNGFDLGVQSPFMLHCRTCNFGADQSQGGCTGWYWPPSTTLGSQDIHLPEWGSFVSGGANAVTVECILNPGVGLHSIDVVDGNSQCQAAYM